MIRENPLLQEPPMRPHTDAGVPVGKLARAPLASPIFAPALSVSSRRERVDHERMLEQVDRVAPVALAPGFGVAA